MWQPVNLVPVPSDVAVKSNRVAVCCGDRALGFTYQALNDPSRECLQRDGFVIGDVAGPGIDITPLAVQQYRVPAHPKQVHARRWAPGYWDLNIAVVQWFQSVVRSGARARGHRQ